MEKSLILLSVLMISGAVIPSVIAAALHEKQEIEDEIMNLQRKDNLEDFDESEIPDEMIVESDEFPNVSEEIRNILHKYVIMFTADQPLNPAHDLAYTIDMDIKIKRLHESIPNGVIEKDKRLIASDSTIVENNDDFEQKIQSSEIMLTTTVTEAATITNTQEMSGEIEIPEIPLVGGKGKIGFKLSRASSTTNTTSQLVSKKMPSQSVNLKPNSSKKIISQLYGTDFISKYLLSFEIDESSTFSLEFKKTPVDIIRDIYLGTIGGFLRHPTKIDGLNLKSALQEWADAIDERYPTTTINCGSTPCIQFENGKVYIKYFPLEVNTVRTELYSHIEKID